MRARPRAKLAVIPPRRRAKALFPLPQCALDVLVPLSPASGRPSSASSEPARVERLSSARARLLAPHALSRPCERAEALFPLSKRSAMTQPAWTAFDRFERSCRALSEPDRFKRSRAHQASLAASSGAARPKRSGSAARAHQRALPAAKALCASQRASTTRVRFKRVARKTCGLKRSKRCARFERNQSLHAMKIGRSTMIAQASEWGRPDRALPFHSAQE